MIGTYIKHSGRIAIGFLVAIAFVYLYIILKYMEIYWGIWTVTYIQEVINYKLFFSIACAIWTICAIIPILHLPFLILNISFIARKKADKKALIRNSCIFLVNIVCCLPFLYEWCKSFGRDFIR